MSRSLARAGALLLTLCLLLGLCACGGGGQSTDNYNLRAIDGGWSIEGVKELSEEDELMLLVPGEIRDKPVLALGTNAFKDEPRLTAVSLPEGLTTSGDGAFMGATVQAVDLPESLTRLGRSAFQDCELGLVTVPAGVTELDMWTFSGASLRTAELKGVTSIGREAFLNCAWMSEITLPASLTRIGIDAFAGCDRLQEIDFGGTTAEFLAIDFGIGWLTAKDVLVVCTDGNLLLEDESTWSHTDREPVFSTADLLVLRPGGFRLAQKL